jgi:tripartite-type tricarboxylate transporter receptor subunit TctC
MNMKHVGVLSALSAALVGADAAAAGYPEQPVRIIVPFSTGGGTDIQARLLADAFYRSTGQTFIVDNKPGASGLVGAQLAANAPAEADNWYAMFFRKGTPREAIEKMNAEIRKALASEQVKQFMAREALDPVGSSPQELAAQMKREMAKYGDVIRIGQINLQ